MIFISKDQNVLLFLKVNLHGTQRIPEMTSAESQNMAKETKKWHQALLLLLAYLKGIKAPTEKAEGNVDHSLFLFFQTKEERENYSKRLLLLLTR